MRGSFLKSFCLSALLFALFFSLSSAPAETGLEKIFVKGVYWPWERTQGHADAAGMELWEFVDTTMARIKEQYHCNLVWFVNGPKDPPRVCDIAEKHGIKVLVGTRLAHLMVWGIRNEEEVRTRARDTVAPLKNKTACAGYVLKDEPRNVEFEQMESFRGAMAREDPSRPSIVVTMTGHTEPYALRTGFPIICTDIYHFGGLRSPYIPNPSWRSQMSFRNCATGLVEMAHQRNKAAWTMPQAFADYWGASWLDKDNNLVLEPGGYWHWRMPTPAEIRWQTWESIRAGCRGVVFFSILLGGPNTWTPEQGEIPEKIQERMKANLKAHLPVLRRRVQTGAPVCLNTPGGGPTAQSRALGKLFGALDKLGAILPGLRSARFPVLFADSPASIASFARKGEAGARYCVVVNDDLKSPQHLELFFLSNVSKVVDLFTGKALKLATEVSGTGGLLKGAVDLEPGGGTILRASFKKDLVGFHLFQEDFSGVHLNVKLENAVRAREPRSFGMGARWTVRKSGTPDQQATLEIENLNKHNFGHGSPLRRALADAAKGNAEVFLFVQGHFPKPESLVVSFVDKEGKAGWNKTDHYFLPIRVPQEAVSVRLLLSAGAAVRSLRFWRITSR